MGVKRSLACVLALASTLLALLVPPVALAAPVPQGREPSVEVKQGGEIAWPELRDIQQGADGIADAELVLQNSHSIWYAIRGLNGAWTLLPPCQLKGQWNPLEPLRYDCSESVASMGRLPLRPGAEYWLPVDGVGGNREAADVLAFAYGAEVFWRAALGEGLPPTVAKRLEGAAYGLGEAAETNVGAVPVTAFYRIAKGLGVATAPGERSEPNLLEAADAIADLVENPQITDWLVAHGLIDAQKMNGIIANAKVLGRPLLVIQLSTLLGELPLRFTLEALMKEGATSGIIQLRVPEWVAGHVPQPAPTAPLPAWRITRQQRGGATEAVLSDGTRTYALPGDAGLAQPWELQETVDFLGTGRPGAVVTRYTGGAHCCTEHLFAVSEAGGIRLYDALTGLGAVEFRDLDGDQTPELVTSEPIAYFGDLGFAGGIGLPLVLCPSPAAPYVECTRRFPALLTAAADGFAAELRRADASPASRHSPALGLVASYARLRRGQEGLQLVRARCSECAEWLIRNNAQSLITHLEKDFDMSTMRIPQTR